MKLTQKKIDDYTVELTVEVEAAEFSKAIKRATKIFGENVNIPGFRRGKAPLTLIKQRVGEEAIINEASEKLLQSSTRRALEMLNLIPVSENKANVITNEDGKDFVFTLTFTPFPKVTLGEYKNLDAEKVVEPVTDEDVDKQIKSMLEHHASLIDAAEGDAIVDGDFITLDYTGTINGEKFAGGEAKDAPLDIGSHKFIGDFEEQLIGAKVGEELTVKVTFPADYHAKDLADKDAEFACKINSIKHRELPELNDEFVKKVSTFQTVDEYKADIRKNMEANAERRAIEAQRQAIIDKAVENMKVDLPPVMVENRVAQMINDLSAQLQNSGMTIEQYMAFSGLDMDKLREDYRETAKKNVLTDIMLEQVAKAEKIAVEPSELNFEISMMSQMYRTPQKQIEKYLRESGKISNVVATILRRKAMKFIIDNMAVAKVETPTEEVKETETPAVKVKESKTSAEEVKEAKAPAVKVKESKTSAEEVKEAKAPAVKVKESKTSVEEVKEAKAPAVEVKETETPVVEVKEAKTPAEDK